jgi:hypothetical protein
MDIGALLFILGLLGLVAAFIGRPLLEQRGLAVTEEDVEFSSLLAQRDRILDSLEELDMDRSMNKVSQNDYQRRRAELVERGAEVLRQLDNLEQQLEWLEDEGRQQFEDTIEEQVKRLRQSRSKHEDVQYCPACGAKALPSDRFCTQCGEPIHEGAGP